MALSAQPSEFGAWDGCATVAQEPVKDMPSTVFFFFFLLQFVCLDQILRYISPEKDQRS